mmetsp:Transcript_25945/g.54841  ORF Transcript_25945/g.54841 Transcript_25945/m.54841 type:complete len:210 (+) Transcript_25945:109-738(+)
MWDGASPPQPSWASFLTLARNISCSRASAWYWACNASMSWMSPLRPSSEALRPSGPTGVATPETETEAECEAGSPRPKKRGERGPGQPRGKSCSIDDCNSRECACCNCESLCWRRWYSSSVTVRLRPPPPPPPGTRSSYFDLMELRIRWFSTFKLRISSRMCPSCCAPSTPPDLPGSPSGQEAPPRPLLPRKVDSLSSRSSRSCSSLAL